MDKDYLFYWSLRDLCERATGATLVSAYDNQLQSQTFSFLENVIQIISGNSNLKELLTLEEIDYFETLTKLYILPKYYNRYLTVTATADDVELYGAFDGFMNLFFRTKDAYIMRLKSYEALKGQLTSQLSSRSSGSVLYNDTPANAGDFADDPHTTNVTRSKNESFSDAGTAANRLAEIDNSIRSVYNEWCNQWRYCFFENPYLKRKETPLYD